MHTKAPIALLAAFLSTGLASTYIIQHSASYQHRSNATDLILAPYDQPQKVVYHITEGDSWLRHHSIQVLQSITNHVNAVAREKREIRVVLQGGGLDLLYNAKTDKTLSSMVDRLKAEGVRFVVCRNTLISRHLDYQELYDVNDSDIVAAGVAEAARLQGIGFAYLKL